MGIDAPVSLLTDDTVDRMVKEGVLEAKLPFLSFASEFRKVSAPARLFLKGTFKMARVTQVALICGLSGMVYGCFFAPQWIELVEFGQVIAGTVQYAANNPWYYEAATTRTLLAIVPALLLKAGFSPWFLCVFFTGLVDALSFIAVGLTTFIFSQSVALAAFAPLAFLTYEFGSNHYYPTAFPMFFFCFGNIGAFLGLLVIALVALQLNLPTAILAGLMYGLHPSWAVVSWISSFVSVCLQRPFKFNRKIATAFCLSFAVVLAGFAIQNRLVSKLHGEYPPQPPIPGTIVPSHYPSSMELLEVIGGRDENGFPASHNVHTFDAPNVWFEAGNFFLSEFGYLVVLALLFGPFRRLLTKPEKKFIICWSAIMSFSLILKVFDEYNHFAFFSVIYRDLPFYMARVITGRWLNLNEFIIPIVVGSLLFRKIRAEANLLAFVGLTLLIYAAFFLPSWALWPPKLSPRPYYYVAGLVWLCLLLSEFLPRLKLKLTFSVLNARRLVILTALATLLIASKTAYLSVTDFAHRLPFLGHDQYDPIERAAKNDGGTIITADVKGINGFNPQLRTGRAFMVRGAFYPRGDTRGVYLSYNLNLKVYCADIFDPGNIMRVVEREKQCFENHTADDWRRFGKEFAATGVLVNDKWKIQLPLEAAGGGFALYKIPAE